MPIVFVCNAELDIVWIDNNFCATVDCGRHVALGRSLFDFLSVPAVDPFRADVAALGKGLERTTYSTTFRGRDGDELIFTFYIERVPSFEGVEGATLISVGMQQPGGERGGEYPPALLKGAGVGDPMRQAYRYSNLRLDDGARLYSRLERIVEEESLYRARSFTLEVAAARLETNALYISQITNFFSGNSFPNYLNQKRLAKLETILRRNPDIDFTEAWQQAGFGSYSSLNRYLRTARATSPSKFLKAVRDN